MTYDPKCPIIFTDHWDIFRHFFEESGSMTSPIAPLPQATPNPAGGTTIQRDDFSFAMKGGALYSSALREMQEETGVMLPPPIFVNGVFVGDPVRAQRDRVVTMIMTDGDIREEIADYVDFIKDGASL